MLEKLKSTISEHKVEIIVVSTAVVALSLAYYYGYTRGFSVGQLPPENIMVKFFKNNDTGEIDFLRINGEVYKLRG